MTEIIEKRLCFFGSRTLKGKAVEDLMISEIEKYRPTMIVTSGETDGVCAAARRLSRRFAIPLKVYWLDFRKHARDQRIQKIMAENPDREEVGDAEER